MTATAAILYAGDAYTVEGERPMGRHTAGEGFLRALARHGRGDPLYCLAGDRRQFDAFCAQVRPWAPADRRLAWIAPGEPGALAEAGALFRPDPVIGPLAWQRRFADQSAYSVCGITHTIATRAVMDAVGDLLIAPLQPWDALVCISQAARTMVSNMLDAWAEYLAARLGAEPAIDVQLPVIPLGVHCDDFPAAEQAPQLRARLRADLGIAGDAAVLLFVGRQVFYGKAHPVPLFLAAERAAAATGRELHLIQVGWFENAREERAFRAAAARFCPSVRCHWPGWRDRESLAPFWAVADVFVFLSDNIQETFAQAPLEAMANGLPVVVSDWDGCREAVRDGVEGFRVPIRLAPAGAGGDLALAHLGDTMNYGAYIGHACMATAVDVDACARALTSLIEDPELRARMGAAGRRRARETYDWRVIVAAYEALWEELAQRRASATVSVPLAPGRPPHPLCPDPFAAFAHYAGQPWDDGWPIVLGPSAEPGRLAELRDDWMAWFGAGRRLSEAAVDALLQRVGDAGPLSAGALVAAEPTADGRRRAVITLLHLLKLDVLRVAR